MISILSKQQFDTTKPDPEAIAVRIIDPEQVEHVDITGYKDEIKLEFWDIEDPIGRFEPITQKQAHDLYNFLKKHKDSKLVVHCMAGISRSNTVAQFFALHIKKDDILASILANDQTKMINYAIWDALKYEAMKDNN